MKLAIVAGKRSRAVRGFPRVLSLCTSVLPVVKTFLTGCRNGVLAVLGVARSSRFLQVAGAGRTHAAEANDAFRDSPLIIRHPERNEGPKVPYQ
jgi:hypothetical protein